MNVVTFSKRAPSPSADMTLRIVPRIFIVHIAAPKPHESFSAFPIFCAPASAILLFLKDAIGRRRIMNKKKLVFTISKLIALVLVLYIGIPYVISGYQLSQGKPAPEKPLSYEADMMPKAGPSVGKLKIRLEPTDAFVIGDKITADIEVEVNWLHENETATVYIRFIDCLSVDARWAWTNTSHYNEYIFPEYNFSMATYSVYKARAFLWFTHEGIFGANVTVYSPYSEQLLASPFFTPDGTVNWSFPEIVHIKSYNYIEERANAQFTNALAVEILGLTIIALSPIAVTIVSLVERVYDSLKEKPKDATTFQSQNK